MVRTRLAPDPCVGVSDLQKAFEYLCKREGTWDLHALLIKGKEAKTWKNSPCAVFLSGHMAALCQELFKVCRNGLLASKKIKSALEKLQKQKHRVNHSKLSDPDFWDLLDQQIRIAASHYRDLKLSGSRYAACMRKASVSEKEQIDGVLQFLTLKAEEQEVGEESKEVAGSSAEKVSEKAQGAPGIFKKVLTKKLSEASTPEKRMRTKGPCSPKEHEKACKCHGPQEACCESKRARTENCSQTSFQVELQAQKDKFSLLEGEDRCYEAREVCGRIQGDWQSSFSEDVS